MRKVLDQAGFGANAHYYYALDCFALGTSLEKFKKEGSISAEKRFIKTFSDQKFSYYEVFKSMFFDLEADYRMFIFIVASEGAEVSNDAMIAGRAEALIHLNHKTLPEDLKVKNLSHKKLTALVYHFHQNDIAQVPELNLSGNLSLKEHLKNAGLTALIK